MHTWIFFLFFFLVLEIGMKPLLFIIFNYFFLCLPDLPRVISWLDMIVGYFTGNSDLLVHQQRSIFLSSNEAHSIKKSVEWKHPMLPKQAARSPTGGPRWSGSVLREGGSNEQLWKMRLCKLELPRDALKVYYTQFLKGGLHKTGRR